MKKSIKYVILNMEPILVFFLSFFFERQYLKGKYFNTKLSGYFWAIQAIWQRSILRLGRPMPFPIGLHCHVSNGKNIHFHPDDLNNFQARGTYYQNFIGEIFLGRGCYIAPNVGLITANHDFSDLDRHLPPKNIVIGESCWIGMNSVILPGVTLGPKTIVGAGSVVSKSFPKGRCVIAGSPARLIRILVETEDFIESRNADAILSRTVQ